MEMSNSGANPAVSHAQITRRSLGPIETFNSDPKRCCFACKNHRCGLGPIETSFSDANRVVLHVQNDS